MVFFSHAALAVVALLGLLSLAAVFARKPGTRKAALAVLRLLLRSGTGVSETAVPSHRRVDRDGGGAPTGQSGTGPAASGGEPVEEAAGGAIADLEEDRPTR
ncbi:hypothetical protein L6E12_26970 [Actinokineospora sp. PR83]|uniref:hypothetical protein n=1 Tax=Actinokineospora sp. PR83 TaxID=2884908 RepID=UPI001F15CD2B|nr:hypothetical protein [Actinokineospora sp. PR83]MCG8919423.1 hypothetical protein [Actinokineospora sp. PR83]